MNACFVCLENSPPLIQPCNCSSWVHPTCFATMVERVGAHARGCPVCTQPYSVPLHLRHVCYTLEVNRTCICILLFVPTQLALAASVTLYMAYIGLGAPYTLASVLFVCIAIFFIIVIVRRHGRPRAQWVRHERCSPTAGRCTYGCALVECRVGVAEPSVRVAAEATVVQSV